MWRWLLTCSTGVKLVPFLAGGELVCEERRAFCCSGWGVKGRGKARVIEF